jgi:hypothetical protein
MEPNQPDVAQPTQPLFTSSPTGALVKMLRTEREMKTYAFTEGELGNLGTLNTILNIFVALGGAAIGFMLSTYLDCLNVTDKLRISRDYGALTIGAVILLICAAVCVWSARSRISEVERVKRESRTIVDGS